MPPHGKCEILVFGATGGTGAAIVRHALQRGFGITIFARDSNRVQQLFGDLATHLTVIEGDATNHDPDSINTALNVSGSLARPQNAG